ncbi:MAG: metal-dependent hydrolase [Planctomyces sp.]|nr:metal-dependent hydrolase [Planctomyces sp.]
MEVVFLGTGGYHPNARRHTAGVAIPEARLVFDAGTSAFRIAQVIPPGELNVFLTHAHLDHVCGLTYLLAPLLTGHFTGCRLYGSKKTLDAVRTHLFADEIFPILPAFEFQEVTAETRVGQYVVRSQPMVHPGGSLAYRVDDAASSLAYVTDTVASSAYVDFVREVDLLIHECSFRDRDAKWCEPTGHSHTSAVARVARDAQVKQLYLTHIDPRETGDDPVDLALARQIFAATFVSEDLSKVKA